MAKGSVRSWIPTFSSKLPLLQDLRNLGSPELRGPGHKWKEHLTERGQGVGPPETYHA